jgi:peroxiredoxin
LADYRDAHDEIRALGARLVALSVDEPERSRALREKLGLPFLLLCDSNREVVSRWGLLNVYEKGGIAYPAVFVLDEQRMIRFRSLDRLASRVSSRGVVEFLRGKPPTSRTSIWPGLFGFWQATLNMCRFGLRSPRLS